MTRILVRLAIIILGTASILLIGSLFWFGCRLWWRLGSWSPAHSAATVRV